MSKKKKKNNALGERLRELRAENEYTLGEVANATEIALAVLSKIETGKRKINKEQLQNLIRLYRANSKELSILFLCEKVMEILEKEINAPEVLKLVAQQFATQKGKKKKK